MTTDWGTREWIFTFGFDHSHPVSGIALGRKFVRIRGDVNTSRAEMIRRFGRTWAFQYPTEEMAGVAKYHLHEYIEFIEEKAMSFYPADWPKCVFCGDNALDGHLTCGRADCSESEARENARADREWEDPRR